MKNENIEDLKKRREDLKRFIRFLNMFSSLSLTGRLKIIEKAKIELKEVRHEISVKSK